MRSRAAIRPLLVVAGAGILLHTLTNGNYGLHRDELATLDDGRHLAWGFVAYPPFTPLVARLGFALFGDAPAGIRLFAALAQAIVAVLAGLIAYELGGSRKAQVVAALAVAASPVSLAAGHLLQYVSFDLLWGVTAVYCVVRLLSSEDPRWWVPAGAAVGMGFMTRYTTAWLVAGLLTGFLISPARRFLASRWLLAGAAIALVIVSPNLIWQAQHGFISAEFLRSIHARDVRNGRTDWFLLKQCLVPAAPFTIPLWGAGLYFYFRNPGGERYRALGWAFLAALTLFAVARARDYYSAPLYPMLLAAGAVMWDGWPGWVRKLTVVGLAVALISGAALILPLGPIPSRLFAVENALNGDLKEEVGWHDFVDEVAAVFDGLPPDERARTGILTGNYGEGGAVDLYGAERGLPAALSRVNSFWLRGYGPAPPQTLVVTGVSRKFVEANFTACEAKGLITNRSGVANEETEQAKYLWLCRGLKRPWPEFWSKIKTWS